MNKKLKNQVIYSNFPEDNLAELEKIAEKYLSIKDKNIKDLLNVDTLATLLDVFASIINGTPSNNEEISSRRELYYNAASIVYGCLFKTMKALNADPQRVMDREVEIELTIRRLSETDSTDFDIIQAKEMLSRLHFNGMKVPKSKLDAIDNMLTKVRYALIAAVLRDIGIVY